MIAVSNTTPLRYLFAINQEHLLGELFEKVCVPVAVHEELTDPKTPLKVRQLASTAPQWLEVTSVPPDRLLAFPVSMHRGEREAIVLTEMLRADVLLMDERMGRSVAASRNLPLSGTLGVLERADTVGLVTDFPEVLRQLKANGFFIQDALEQRLLERHELRRRVK